MIPAHTRNQYPNDQLDSDDNTTFTLFRREIPRSTLVEVELSVRVQRTTTFGVALFRRVYRVENNAGTVTIRQSFTPLTDYNPNGYAIGTSTATDTFSVTGTGANGHDLIWDVEILRVQGVGG